VRVIYCYNDFEDNSFNALCDYAPNAELVYTGETIYSYNEAIASRWTGESDLVVIESDKEITAEVLPSFESCTSYWCSYSYFIYPKMMEREVEIGLGCTRYSAKLQKLIRVEEFICEDSGIFGASCSLCGGKGCWKFLDSRIADAVRGHGINVHCHGRIKHHHNYDDLLRDRDSFEITALQQSISMTYRRNNDEFNQNEELAGPMWQRTNHD
jgi:hypothetical protein